MRPDDLAARARQADAEAREHKQAERRHRRAAREARQRQAAIEAQCAALGIKLTYQSTPTAQETIHGQRPDTRSQHAH